ncbi:MAG TPA: hypothetical protein VNY84_00075 [Acidimicrobiales bacterium]|jgi:hypothetical protein|nr:hypothetical protein [Acidimicrobiales bacterium]
MAAESLRFSVIARAVASEARRLGLRVPGFRSPPRLHGATRTIRRADGSALVAVAIRGRPLADVVADVIEGVVVANGLRGAAAVRCRRRLASAVDALSCFDLPAA